MTFSKLIANICIAALSTLIQIRDGLAQTPGRPNIIVILTDDMGYADMGVQKILDDIRTPNLDALAQGGVLITNGYVTAPQCQPSRAGLITGRYQTRFNMELNGDGPLKQEEITIAERLKEAGYITGMAGKWHLEIGRKEEEIARRHRQARSRNTAGATERVPDRTEFMPWNQGFDEFLTGSMQRYFASHLPDGTPLASSPTMVNDTRFRIDVQSEWAVSFVERNADKPFFLYLSLFAPHVPLEAPKNYLDRFPGASGERQLALAMLSAVDDGVGRLMAKLKEKGIEKRTLVIFLSDNGAPLREKAWNGSLNTPLVGEKGMLTEGGIRIPFIAHWASVLPAGTKYEHPVISLDIAATATTLAGLEHDERLDGVNLMPFLLGKDNEAPHKELFWRWRSQSAMRMGQWKLVKLSDQRTYLYNLHSKEGERKNLLPKKREIAREMERKLAAWAAEMNAPGLPSGQPVQADISFYDSHVK